MRWSCAHSPEHRRATQAQTWTHSMQQQLSAARCRRYSLDDCDEDDRQCAAQLRRQRVTWCQLVLCLAEICRERIPSTGTDRWVPVAGPGTGLMTWLRCAHSRCALPHLPHRCRVYAFKGRWIRSKHLHVQLGSTCARLAAVSCSVH